MSAPSARTLSPLLVLLLATTLAACGGGGSASPERAASAAPGGTLTFATDTEVDCYDPHISQADVTGVVMRNVYDSLVVDRGDGTFGPWLATKWEVADGGRRYTFTLRDDVTFTDGTPFDAAAVKANLDRIADPKTKSKFAIGLIGPYAGTDVLAPNRVRVRFDEPFGTFLRSASTTYLGFHSPKTIEAGRSLCAGSAETQVGTGPFELESATRGQGVSFVRNDDYDWAPDTAEQPGPAKLDRLEVRWVADPTVRVGGVTSGQIDVADAIPPNEVTKLERNARVKLQSTDAPGLGYTYFLNTEDRLFRDRDLRLAVQKAFDLDAAVKAVYFDQYERAWSPLTPATLGHDASLEGTWPHDADAANALLDGAGWTARDADGYRTKDGERLATRLLYVPQYTSEDRAALDQALQADLKAIGFELELVPMDAAAYEPVRNAGRYGLIGFAWGGSDPDLLRTLFDSEQRFDDGGNNAARLRDNDVDEWLRDGSVTTDVAQRERDYAQVQERLIRDGVALPTAVPKIQLAERAAVQGIAFDANGWPLFHGATVR